jgi:hypothetical protein
MVAATFCAGCVIFESRAMAVLVQMERHIKDLEARLLSTRLHDHNSLESGTIAKLVS